MKNIFKPSPRGALRWKLFGICILFVLTFGYAGLEWYKKDVSLGKFPNAFRLGLDLKGGTHLVYETDLRRVAQGDRSSSVEGVRDVIERRVNAFGVAEPIVQTVKAGDSYRVIVELAGVSDVNQAIKMIGDTPLLEFKEQATQAEQKKELTPEQKKELADYNANARKKIDDILKRARAPQADFGKLAKDVSEDPQSKDNEGDIGWISTTNNPSSLFDIVSKLSVGEVHKEVLTVPGGYAVVKLLETRSTEKEYAAHHILICYEGASRCDSKLSKDDAKKKIEDLKKKATPQNVVQLAKENSTEPGAKDSGGDLGWFSKTVMVKPFADAVEKLPKGAISDVVETEFGYHVIYKKDERPLPEYKSAWIATKTRTDADYLPPPSEFKDTGLTGTQLKRASADIDLQTNSPFVSLEFNDEGKKLFGEITSRNVGKPVAILLDGQAISRPTVNEPITDGKAIIQGNFTLKETKLLAQRLNTGALPVPITLVSQQTIGPTLGAESLEKSLKAGLLGFLLVALFMIGFYRLPGVLAVFALIVYTSIVLALFKIWPVTLSLAGIAGFILSIGMAVDANVLIFERTKEELRLKKSLDASIRDGFRRAWTSIRDSNAASLITCAILFWFSASLIKGFALTLAIGILVSMFSAIFITRLLLKLVAGWRVSKNTWLFCAKKTEEQVPPNT
ncbi:protein translocase subunit SecD [Candidatus Uhrbacteria bacterium]|nr:protein translocase subunit SecD [Candidatus Uhrbacteria bacterium]